MSLLEKCLQEGLNGDLVAKVKKAIGDPTLDALCGEEYKGIRWIDHFEILAVKSKMQQMFKDRIVIGQLAGYLQKIQQYLPQISTNQNAT